MFRKDYDSRENDPSSEVSIYRFGNVLLGQRIIKGKSWFNMEPSSSLNQAKNAIVSELKARSEGVKIVGSIDLNRGDEGSYSGGAHLVAVIAVDLESPPEPITDPRYEKVLDNLEIGQNSMMAEFVIQDKLSTTMLGKFESQTLFPLAVFADRAVKTFGELATVSAGLAYNNMVIRCSAIKL